MRLALAALVMALGGAACALPCETDDDCPELNFCQAGACTRECVEDAECHVGFQCSTRGQCIELATGSISWVEPKGGDTVPDTFDGVVHVSFRATTARIRVYRNVGDTGDPCVAVPPFELDVTGDPEKTFEQDVVLPGLHAGGARFTLVAGLEAAGGFTSDDLALEGDLATAPGGFTLSAPAEGVLDGEPTFVPLSGEVVASAPRTLSLTVVPEEGAPLPTVLLDPELRTVSGLLAPVARGRQAIVLEATFDDDSRIQCARGVTVAPGPPGIELALWFEGTGDIDVVLDQRLRVDGGDGGVVCSSADTGDGCALVRQTDTPVIRGEEILVLEGIDEGVVSVAVVPGTAGEPIRAGVRVSSAGRHVGFLGPFSLDPQRGEVWLAGDLLVSGGGVTLAPDYQLVTGSPW